MHVYRWDLDKTYIQTEIESVRGLIRAAMQSAQEKRNVPGSAALLRALIAFDPTAKVHILSGSPTQMRDVLEEKLALDGVRFDSLTLKDNLGNIRKRRFRAVTDQLGYKLPTLLSQRVGLGAGVRETLFGDDSELDALVYTVYADAVAGRIDEQDLTRILDAGNVYADDCKAALRSFRKLSRADAVEDIFINVAKGLPIHHYRVLGKRVIPVFSWFQAALVLWDRGRLDLQQVTRVVRACVDEAALPAPGAGSLLQDAVRRGLIGAGRIRELLADDSLAPLRDASERALDRLGTIEQPQIPSTPDYVAFLRATGH